MKKKPNMSKKDKLANSFRLYRKNRNISYPVLVNLKMSKSYFLET